MNDPKQLTGVLPVIQTPFDVHENIDVATLEKEIEWLYECGSNGIVTGMVSELLRLSTEERQTLAELVCRFGGKCGPVIISVGAESSVLAERFARHAEAQGASALMAIPPISIALIESELMGYYERLVRSVSIPLIVQDASGYVGRPMSIDLQSRMMKEFGHERVLFKPEAAPIGPRLSELRDATGGKARIFEGTGGLALVDSYRRGIVGTIPGADLIRGIVALWRALEEGNEKRVRQISTPLCALVGMQNSLDSFLAIEKYLLVKHGIFRNTIVRGPVGYVLNEATRQQVDRLFDLMIAAVENSDAH